MLTTLPAQVSGDSKKVPLLLDIADTALALCGTYNQRYSIRAFTITSDRLLDLKVQSKVTKAIIIKVVVVAIVHRVPVSSPIYCSTFTSL